VRGGITAALAGLLLLSLVFGIAAHPQRSALFATALHPEQLAEVQEQLAQWNVPFTPVSDNVLVDAGRRNAVLLRLSLAGVPHAHVEASSDVLGKLGVLTPQAVIDAQTRDGLAGDIELALRGVDGVQDARVIIAPAKPGYFADESSRDATASVRVRLTPGTHLSNAAVDGIRAFVAAAVPALDARHVTIVDDRGIALGEESGADDAANLERSLQSALDTALGAGEAIVRVHVDYDTRTVTSKETRRSALSSMPITASTQDEHYVGAEKRYERSDRQLDRGSDSQETSSTAPAGRVARISAAVFVDAARTIDLAQVRGLAAAALGIDVRRGDTIEVAAIPFSRARPARKDVWWLAYGAIVPVMPTVLLVAGGLVALSWARAPLSTLLRIAGRRASVARATANVRGIGAAGVRNALAGEPPHAAAAVISALPAATAAAVLDMYPEHERAAIVRRMQRNVSPLLADAENLLANA